MKACGCARDSQNKKSSEAERWQQIYNQHTSQHKRKKRGMLARIIEGLSGLPIDRSGDSDDENSTKSSPLRGARSQSSITDPTQLPSTSSSALPQQQRSQSLNNKDQRQQRQFTSAAAQRQLQFPAATATTQGNNITTPATATNNNNDNEDGQQQADGSFIAAALSPTWQALVGGAAHIFDALVPPSDEDDEEDAEYTDAVDTQQKQQQPTTPTSTSSHTPKYKPKGPSDAYPTVRHTSSTNELSSQGEGTDEWLRTATTRPAVPLVPLEDQPLPVLSEASGIMDGSHIRALLGEIPLRYRECKWVLLYSTMRDGISMQTLLRNGRGKVPTVLVVRDMHKHVFGAYCSEAWHLSTRYFGTGESFVFQLAPQPSVWHWWWEKMRVEQNDYFMWGQTGANNKNIAIAVGGSGGYALWLDGELHRGISRVCTTFGSECLASEEEFRIGAVELWGLV